MPASLYFLYLDRDHQDDPLFVQALGRALAQAGTQVPRCILFHGSGMRAVRWHEATGALPVSTPPPALIERAIREESRKIVGVLTDASVPAVGLHGVDRGLLRRTAEGAVAVRNPAWLPALADNGVLPVVSTLAADAGGAVCEADVPETILAVAKNLKTEHMAVVFFTKKNRPGIAREGVWLPTIPLADLPGDGVAAVAAVHRVVAAGLPVLLTSPLGLAQQPGPQGTRVVP